MVATVAWRDNGCQRFWKNFHKLERQQEFQDKKIQKEY
jgi:hypothetical protein